MNSEGTIFPGEIPGAATMQDILPEALARAAYALPELSAFMPLLRWDESEIEGAFARFSCEPGERVNLEDGSTACASYTLRATLSAPLGDPSAAAWDAARRALRGLFSDAPAMGAALTAATGVRILFFDGGEEAAGSDGDRRVAAFAGEAFAAAGAPSTAPETSEEPSNG